MKYRLPITTIEWALNRSIHKGGFDDLGTDIFAYSGMTKRKGSIGLYDRNTGRYVYFKVLHQALDFYGYIVERKTPIPIYWKDTMQQQELERGK